MGRTFKIKGHNKRKSRTNESYTVDQPEKVAEIDEQKDELKNESKRCNREEKAYMGMDVLPGIPIPPSESNLNPGVIFFLEKASLEVAKVGKTYQILNSEDHTHFLKKHNRNALDYRPDIVHQALLTILDSPLNKAGKVSAIYVRTEKDILFEVKPNVRIPRTYKRFAGIILQLLQKFSITATGNGQKLIRVVKNPVSKYFPPNSRKIGLSYSSEKMVDMHNYLSSLGNDEKLVFIVGAMAHGKIEGECVDECVSKITMDGICHCGRTTNNTSWTNLNPGRRYNCCQKFRSVSIH